MVEPQEKTEIKEIHENPNLDEIWDLCVRNFLYDPTKYLAEVENIFSGIGIDKNAKIADVSAGGGLSVNRIDSGWI